MRNRHVSSFVLLGWAVVGLAGAGCGAASTPKSNSVETTQNPLESSGAVQLYASVTNSSGAHFPGESDRVTYQGYIPAFQYENSAAKTSGMMDCGTFKMTKASGTASPLFYNALATGEALKVELKFVEINGEGMELVTHETDLTHAVVIGIEHVLAPVSSTPGSPAYELEVITFGQVSTVAVVDTATNVIATLNCQQTPTQNPIEASGAVQLYASVTDSSGAHFPGESDRVTYQGYIPAFQYENSATKAVGTTDCGTFKMTKAWGTASPLFYNAMATGGRLGVKLKFVEINYQGTELVTHETDLTNAVVIGIEHILAPVSSTPGSPSYELEVITFGQATTVSVIDTATNVVATLTCAQPVSTGGNGGSGGAGGSGGTGGSGGSTNPIENSTQIQLYATVTTSAGVAFPGESQVAAYVGSIPGFQYQNTSTKGTTMNCGDFQMTKAWGNASPRLYQALSSAEKLTVKLRFVALNKVGSLVVTDEVDLANAVVTGISRLVTPISLTPGSPSYDLELLTFGKVSKVTVSHTNSAGTVSTTALTCQ
ncbi:MAG TPA: type VI secretion system tube protein Hcp [Polyangia bacterium]|nr:type VI secretion system tube protein Hcp [Polyangia bacterium]